MSIDKYGIFYPDEACALLEKIFEIIRNDAINDMHRELNKIKIENEQLKTQRDKAYKDLESKDKLYLEALIQERVKEKLNETATI